MRKMPVIWSELNFVDANPRSFAASVPKMLFRPQV